MTKGKRLVHKISKCKYSDFSANEIKNNTGNSFAKILCYNCWVWGKSQPSPLLQISRSYLWAPAHMNSLATFTGLGLRCFTIRTSHFCPSLGRCEWTLTPKLFCPACVSSFSQQPKLHCELESCLPLFWWQQQSNRKVLLKVASTSSA